MQRAALVSIDSSEMKYLGFLLGRQLLLDLCLDASKQEGPENSVQTLDELLVLKAAVFAEPGVEVVCRIEDIGQKEVQQRPELVQVVLQRSARQQQSVLGLQLAHNVCQL